MKLRIIRMVVTAFFLMMALTGAAQYFGIGTPNPQTTLDIAGNGPAHMIRLTDTLLGNQLRWTATSAFAGLPYLGSTNATGITLGTQNQPRLIISADGNVGIGTLSPAAPLQFAANVANRKIVLWSTLNNDHEFFGFGINSNILRYQVTDANDAHVFYAGVNGTTSLELMRIRGNGWVGIGTATPRGRLDVAGTDNIYLSGQPDIGNGQRIFLPGSVTLGPSFGDISYIHARRLNNTGSSAIQIRTNNNGVTVNAMRIDSTGFVGIGTTTPNAPLQFSNSLVNRKIVLWDQRDNDHRYLGFGINTGMLRYQVGAAVTDSHVFFAGTSDSTSVELMRIGGNGRVGIGVTAPTAKLHINGHQKIDSAYTLEWGAGIGGKEMNAGKIGYEAFTPGALDIVGAGNTVATRRIKLFAEGGLEITGQITQQTAQNAALLNGWSNFGGTYTTAGYWKDKEGLVHLRGLIAGGNTANGTILLNLPAGYRPTAGRIMFTVLNNNTTGRIDINTSGDVIVEVLSSNVWLNLTGIYFRTD
jgi:hypothetical protein